METTYITAWMPIFIILFLIIIPQQTSVRNMARLIINRKKGRSAMTNELVKKYIGKYCYVTTGNMGVSAKGKIVEVNENWVEVETKSGIEIINLDFIQNIKVKG